MVGVGWKRWKQPPTLPWDAFETEADQEVPIRMEMDLHLTTSAKACPLFPVSVKSPKTEGSNESLMLVNSTTGGG